MRDSGALVPPSVRSEQNPHRNFREDSIAKDRSGRPAMLRAAHGCRATV